MSRVWNPDELSMDGVIAGATGTIIRPQHVRDEAGWVQLEDLGGASSVLLHVEGRPQTQNDGDTDAPAWTQVTTITAGDLGSNNSAFKTMKMWPEMRLRLQTYNGSASGVKVWIGE